jgi:biotin carboxyl carrier protein
VKLIARYEDLDLAVEVEREGSGYRLTLGERTFHIDMVNCGPYVHSLRFDDGDQFSLIHDSVGNDHEVTLRGSKVKVEIVDPLALRRKQREDSAGEGGIVKALMPGRIVRILVETGQEVAKGTGILILEAMKMENEIQAPAEGTIAEIFVKPGDTVEGGAPLVHLV